MVSLISPFINFYTYCTVTHGNTVTAAARLLETAGEKRCREKARKVTFLCYYLLILNLIASFFILLSRELVGLLMSLKLNRPTIEIKTQEEAKF